MSSLYYYYADRTVFFGFLQQKSKIVEWFWKSTFGKRPHTICLFLENNEGKMQETNASFSKRPQAIYKKTTKNKGRMWASLWGPKVDFWQEASSHLLVFRKTPRVRQRGAKEEGKVKKREKEGPKRGGKKHIKIS